MAIQLKYIICLDFEMTCWEEKDTENAEIIEFGVVLLNLQSGKIVSEFHEYVRPTNCPILSEYCINLTGITQSLIDAQANFPIVYQKFLLWLEQIRVDYQLHFASPSIRNVTYGADTAFCCWTNWDLSTFLRSDCTRHGIQPKPHLKAWIDTRKMFQKLHPGMFNFQEALDIINIKQSGNAHSGIDDARTLSNMVLNLYHNGAIFNHVTDWRHDDY